MNFILSRWKIAVVLIALFLGGCAGIPEETGSEDSSRIDQAILELIDEAVFEVVVKKPFDSPEIRALKIEEGREDELFEDPLSYEKELPWEVVDYTSRVDEYVSVGTAFAISENQLLTAAHVLDLDNQTMWDSYYIRDKEDQVYELDLVLKYANNRDFTVFTVKGLDGMRHFDLEPEYELNRQVFTVGNALGEGVVVRNGLLTSTTKESENGDWEYLRYSAAASPGNSGGPLLNEKGKVLGIVLKKSENENLNYALPIGEVLNAEENIAVYHRFVSYSLVVTHRKNPPIKRTEEVELPLGYGELRDKLVKLNSDLNRQMLDELLENHRDTFFPYGEGSYGLLHNTNIHHFPSVAGESEEDGEWSLYQPKDIKTARLKDNGYISFGTIGNFTLLRFRKPLDVSLESLMEDSEFFIETFLEGYTLNRKFGNIPIRITSLGKAAEVYTLEDRYQRKWFVQSWEMQAFDTKLVIYAMPTPSGFIALLDMDRVGQIEQALSLDLEEYLHYLFFSYEGTFQEWQDYLALDIPKSALIEDVEFSYTPGDRVSFENSRFRLGYDEDLLPVDDKSIFRLMTTYALEDGEALWAPVGVSFTDKFIGDNYLHLVRYAKPEETLPDGYHEHWTKMVFQRFPFDGSAVVDEDITESRALQWQFTEEKIEEEGFLYFLGIGLEGTKEDEDTEKFFSLIQKQTYIKEGIQKVGDFLNSNSNVGGVF